MDTATVDESAITVTKTTVHLEHVTFLEKYGFLSTSAPAAIIGKTDYLPFVSVGVNTTHPPPVPNL